MAILIITLKGNNESVVHEALRNNHITKETIVGSTLIQNLTELFQDGKMETRAARKLLIELFDEPKLGFSKQEKKEISQSFYNEESISKQTFMSIILKSIPEGENAVDCI